MKHTHLIFGLQDGMLVEREALREKELFKPPERWEVVERVG